MSRIQEFVDAQLSRGRGYFTTRAALPEVGRTPQAFEAAVARLIRKGRLVCPRRGFYLIIRPEDRQLGAPDPARWIDPLMKHLPGESWKSSKAVIEAFRRTKAPTLLHGVDEC